MVQPTSNGHRAGITDVKAMSSHLLPSDHLARILLQKLFRRSDVIVNEAAFLEAGFKIRSENPRSLMRVATHPALRGYVFKVFFVEDLGREREKPCGWKNFTVRCNQAKRIRRVIHERSFRHFRVPHKWLFHTPCHPSCGPDDQPALLVAEFRDLVSRDDNERAWRHSVTEGHLHELYAILKGAGGVSSRPDNIAQTRQGWFAFIDTEYPPELHDYESIAPYLSRQMQQYWSSLIQRAGR
jgi:hypothetical protein